MLGIALRYGIELDQLLAANPEVNPRFLSVGERLIVPILEDGTSLTELPTLTPVPASLSESRCYRTPSQGLWCLITVENTTGGPLEGLVASFSLLDPGGDMVANEITDAPLNLLPEGGSMPLAVFFPPPAPEFAFASARLISAVEISDPEARYLGVEFELEEEQLGPGRLTWRGSGEVSLAADADETAQRIVLLAVGYGEDGTAVGFSKWESDPSIRSGEALEFALWVTSLGPEIDRVEVLAEALRLEP